MNKVIQLSGSTISTIWAREGESCALRRYGLLPGPMEDQPAVPEIDKTGLGRQITSEGVYLGRREFLRNSLLFTATSTGIGVTLLSLMRGLRADERQKPARARTSLNSTALTITRRSDYSSGEAKTPYQSVTNYNNFYEFGTDKTDPAENAHTLRPHPWTVTIEDKSSTPV